MQSDRNKKIEIKIGIIALFTIISILIFIFGGLDNASASYILSKRIYKIIAVLISGSVIALSGFIFQTICQNRILTPGVLGLESVYGFIQTIIVFIFGSSSIFITNKNLSFIVSLIGMAAVSIMLYSFILKKKRKSVMDLMLVGLIVGTFFRSLSSFMQVIIDPNEYLTLQGKLIASFNNVNSEILYLAIVISVLTIACIYDELKYLDILSLGKENAINLGCDYKKIVRKLLIAVTILTAVSTALTGPITFLGLIVTNITYQFVKTFRHKYLIFSGILISIFSLTAGIICVERVFTFNTTLSVIINFIGAVYFLYVVLREEAS